MLISVLLRSGNMVLLNFCVNTYKQALYANNSR